MYPGLKHKLIIIAGNTGCGKTVLATRLSHDTGIKAIDVNDFLIGYPSRLIFESTGLGVNTRTVKGNFPNHIVIKCTLDDAYAIEQIKANKKVFKAHEIKLGKTQLEFYLTCRKNINFMECDMEYDYTKTPYSKALSFALAYLHKT